jgi:hypothetical protein
VKWSFHDKAVSVFCPHESPSAPSSQFAVILAQRESST